MVAVRFLHKSLLKTISINPFKKVTIFVNGINHFSHLNLLSNNIEIALVKEKKNVIED
jgi:hypothetical protein